MNKIEKFKIFIRFIVSIFASREFGFIYCILGTLAQMAHTYYLVESISSLAGWMRATQAVGLSLFISSSLLFFTAIAENVDENDNTVEGKAKKRIHLAVNLFMVIEILINFYYYAAHLIINVDTPNVFDFIFAILVSCLIPVTIKLYAGIIQAKEWLKFFEDRQAKENKEEKIPEDIDSVIDSKINQFKENFLKEYASQIDAEFDKNSDKFMRNLESKIKSFKSNESSDDFSSVKIVDTGEIKPVEIKEPEKKYDQLDIEN